MSAASPDCRINAVPSATASSRPRAPKLRRQLSRAFTRKPAPPQIRSFAGRENRWEKTPRFEHRKKKNHRTKQLLNGRAKPNPSRKTRARRADRPGRNRNRGRGRRDDRTVPTTASVAATAVYRPREQKKSQPRRGPSSAAGCGGWSEFAVNRSQSFRRNITRRALFSTPSTRG